MVSDRAFIFHLYIPLGKILPLVPKLRSSVKIKVNIKVTVFKKMDVAGVFVLHKDILLLFYLESADDKSYVAKILWICFIEEG